MRRLWKDQAGGILSAEYLLLGTLLALGLIFGVEQVRIALIARLEHIVSIVCQ